MTDQEKLELARLVLGFFRGRPDFTALAFTNTRGLVNFHPAKLDRPLRPDRLARDHLGGLTCHGFYLMLPPQDGGDWTVLCACADFDNHKGENPEWADQATRCCRWLLNNGFSPLYEVSQSGNGAHVWLFFDEPIPAWLARSFFQHVLNACGTKKTEVFPKGDAPAEKELGNLVRYPLWGKSRFVDLDEEGSDSDNATILGGQKYTSTIQIYQTASRHSWRLERGPAKETAAEGSASGVSPEIMAAIDKYPHSLLARRWRFDVSDMQGDRSATGCAQSIACELLRQYYTPDQVGSAVRQWMVNQGRGERAAPESWVRVTIAKAYEFLRGRNYDQKAKAQAEAGRYTLPSAATQWLDDRNGGREDRLETGLRTLDEKIRGAPYGEVTLIAGRPGCFKTALAVQWLKYACSKGFPCLFISRDTGALGLGEREAKSVDDVTGRRIYNAEIVSGLKARVASAWEGKAPLWVVDHAYEIDHVEAVIEQHVKHDGVRVVAVDYVQLLDAYGRSEYEQVTAASKRLKNIAVSTGVAMIVVSQFNREIERRDSHVPQLADLRGAGQLEQDARLAIFTHYPRKYDEHADPDALELHVKKNSNGPSDIVVNVRLDAARFQIFDHPGAMQ